MREYTPILSVAEMRPKNVVFSGTPRRPTVIIDWQGITPSESVKLRHSPLAGENLAITCRRCNIAGKLLLITNVKSYTGF